MMRAAVRPQAGTAPAVARAPARLVADGGAYTAVFDVRADTSDPSRAATGPDGMASAEGKPLAGLTVAVKDLIAVAGLPIGAGSAAWAGDAPQQHDAFVVARLRQLGAVVVGLTALHEVAFGVTGINDGAGWPRNPHDPERVPGGSSSGSAVAVVEGSAAIGLGTDTGGSLRIPAALCGAVGYKPSYALYPVHGVLPLAPSLDHVGLLARRLGPIRRVHAALGLDAGQESLPARVGVVVQDLEEADAGVAARVAAVISRLERAGVGVVEVTLPDPDRVFEVSTTVMLVEAAAVHRSTFAQRSALYGTDVRDRLRKGLGIPAAAYAVALRERDRLRSEIATLLHTVDCLVGPTVGCVAPREEQARMPAVGARLVRNTRLANVVGTPALSLPVPGVLRPEGSGEVPLADDPDELPVGLQLMGADDAALLGGAAGIERLLR